VLFYNQHVADCYKSAYHKEAEKASYERQYRNTPAAAAAHHRRQTECGHPAQRALIVKGRYLLQNKAASPSPTSSSAGQHGHQYRALQSGQRVPACRTARWASTATSWPRRWRRAPAGHGF
jgi:hypothetical protein